MFLFHACMHADAYEMDADAYEMENEAEFEYDGGDVVDQLYDQETNLEVKIQAESAEKSYCKGLCRHRNLACTNMQHTCIHQAEVNMQLISMMH